MTTKKKKLGLWVGRIIQLILVVGIIGGAAKHSSYWLSNKPKAKRRKKKRKGTLVSIKNLIPTKSRVKIVTLGTVIPSVEITIASLVSGKVKWINENFTPGGIFKKGDEILKLDPSEYFYTFSIKKSLLKKAESDLEMEMGKQSVAESELKSQTGDLKGGNKDLILRKPQFRTVKASINSAKAGMGQAYLNIKRTKLKVPFNAIVKLKTVDVGSKLAPGSQCGVLVGSDMFWIEVLVSRENIKHIKIPGYNSATGSKAIIRDLKGWGPEAFREGTVDKLMVNLDKGSRLVRLLIKVDDPLHFKKPLNNRHPILLDSMLKVEIQGSEIKNSYKISRNFERNKTIWIMGNDKKLEIRKITPFWIGRDYILVTKGISPKDKLIISNLGAPVSGMILRLKGDKKQPKGKQKKKTKNSVMGMGR
jgi:multidrug efflux pump subunit AcrA (membrane-fusion protein)